MSLKSQIDKINALGRTNLNTKGVTTDGNETTYQLMNMISNIQSGSSVEYSNIVYNDDNTITLIDDKGNIHTISCVYEGDRIVSISYDGENIELEFNGETLVNVGGTHIDVSNAPANTRLKEFIEGTLTEIVDDTITTVGNKALYYNSTIQNVDLPNCASVGQYAFSDCSTLTNINLPSCVTLSKGALSDCIKLTSIVLPNCTTVGDTAFHGCDALERIDLVSVTKVGTKAFYSCDKLTTLIIRTNQVAKVTDGTYLLSYTPIGSGKGYIYVPDNLIENYKVASGWATYKDQIKGLSELEETSNE